MIKRMILMLILVGLVMGGIVGFKIFGHKMMMQYMAGMTNPSQTVSTLKASTQTWQDNMKSIGTFNALKGTDISAETAGLIEKINFESGQDVEEGAILLELSSASDSAHLRSLEAAAKLAEVTYERDLKQLKAQAVSQATVDTDAATLAAARAAVEEQRATLDKKIVRAPFSGRVGIRAVDLGQYLSPGAKIVTLQQIDPLYLDFSLPQRALGILKVGQKVTAKIDVPSAKPVEGEISAIDAKVDEATRNILVRATFANPDRSLIPGMFASTTITVGEPTQAITLPQTAITYNPYGNTVFLIESGTSQDGKPAQTAKQVFVTLGETRGDQVAVLTGVKEGDEVVTAGQLKLRNGTTVIVNNALTPSNDETPAPQDK